VDLRPSERIAARSVFFTILVLFGAQIGFMQSYSEPYPALTQPRFMGTRTTPDGLIEIPAVEAAVTFLDGSHAVLTLAALFPDMHTARRYAAAEVAFHASTPSPSDRVRTFAPAGSLRRWLDETVWPARDMMARRFWTGNPAAPETVEWLRRRLLGIYPNRQPQRVEFMWYDDFYRQGEVSLERTGRALRQIYSVKVN
jgi:hypothetical protein